MLMKTVLHIHCIFSHFSISHGKPCNKVTVSILKLAITEILTSCLHLWINFSEIRA